MDTTLLIVLIISFFSTFARASVGFGNALIAMPLFTLLLGIQIATPLVGLMAVTMSGLILLQSWREVEMAAVWRLTVASFVGTPIGVWLLQFVPGHLVVAGLGLLLIAFGLYSLFLPTLPALTSNRWSYLFGVVAGALGAAYNTAGPPAVVYGVLRRWPPERFRATLQGFFLPSSFAFVVGHLAAGLWNREVFGLFAFSLLPMTAAVIAGHWFNRRIPAASFRRLLYLLVITLGVLLVARSV